MIGRLQEIERVLPELLSDREGWNSLHVDYHKPFVERVWRQMGDDRLCLHRIQACQSDEALFHPHPWPSAMKIIEGSYEMGYGVSVDGQEPEQTCRFILTQDSYYEMLSEKDWHYVRPLTPLSYSLMLIGKPFAKGERKEKPALNLGELRPEVKSEILDYFSGVCLSRFGGIRRVSR